MWMWAKKSACFRARGVARPLRARRVSVISISVTAVDPLFATLSVDVVVRTYLLSQVL